jgi:hypothetical protein
LLLGGDQSIFMKFSDEATTDEGGDGVEGTVAAII